MTEWDSECLYVLSIWSLPKQRLEKERYYVAQVVDWAFMSVVNKEWECCTTQDLPGKKISQAKYGWFVQKYVAMEGIELL